MTQDELKKKVAEAALKYVEDDSIVGIGSGSTVNFFIDALASIKGRIEGAVAASEASAERLKKHGIRVFDLNGVDQYLGRFANGNVLFSISLDPQGKVAGLRLLPLPPAGQG